MDLGTDLDDHMRQNDRWIRFVRSDELTRQLESLHKMNLQVRKEPCLEFGRFFQVVLCELRMSCFELAWTLIGRNV